ncbi:MAG: ATP-binding cassette domain-containing protein [Propionibacteriaceae bacterium]|jgi:ABC-type lipoprotein export system ATPase subunit|nr:ATP-binding cassette domain-containing protein [Propionibacteriaceae bacterium]
MIKTPELYVEAAGIAFGFAPDRLLFEDLSFTLIPNRVYALVGPSGSGKSTLLSMLAGWLEPITGTLCQHQISTTRWVFQNPYGVPRRTALDHVAIAFIAQGYLRREAEEASLHLMAQFGLRHVADNPFGSLSGGEAQRLMLVRGLASDPDLLLLDEPTAQLDRRTAQEINSALEGLARSGTIVVVATHDRETRDVCTDVLDLGEANPVIMMSSRLAKQKLLTEES